jgi:hypothetical protein
MNDRDAGADLDFSIIESREVDRNFALDFCMISRYHIP